MSTCFEFRFSEGTKVPVGSSGDTELLEDRIAQLKGISGIKRHSPRNDGAHRVILVRCATSEDIVALKLRFNGLQRYYKEVPCRAT